MFNRVIARYSSGRVVKGFTYDFSVGKEVIHVRELGSPQHDPPVTVRLRDLKLLAFVKDFEGDPQERSKGQLKPHLPASGRKIRVTFSDGEVLKGTTNAYDPHRQGFFMEPGAITANETRIYVVNASTQEVALS